eukprot:28057_1
MAPKIWCMNDYSATCTLSQISSNVWECTEQSSSCQDGLSVSPSQYSTVSPTTHSSAPSNPSVFPSTMPSFVPTNHPTAFPFHNPTVSLTTPSTAPSNPSAFPSKMPSFIPSNKPSEFPLAMLFVNPITRDPSSPAGSEQSTSRFNEPTKEIDSNANESDPYTVLMIILSIAIVWVLLCICGIKYHFKLNILTDVSDGEFTKDAANQ